MRRGAKRAVIWSCGLGVIAIVAATMMSWEALEERYWLWKLESGDADTALTAAKELSRRQSLRAVRPLVERIRATSTEAAFGWAGRVVLQRPRRGPRDIDPSCTDVYLPPFTSCLHGVGPEAAALLDREIESLDAEIEALYAEPATVDPATEPAVHRTHEALRWVRRAWRDDELEVHAEMPPPQVRVLERL